MRRLSLISLTLGCFMSVASGCGEEDPSDKDDSEANDDSLPGDSVPGDSDSIDADGDGVPAGQDCDDNDGSLGAIAEDVDCDGATKDADCDDGDPGVGAPDVDDADCDGQPTHAGGGEMIRLPATTFDMGCTEGQLHCSGDDAPVMPVTLTHDYYLGQTEVTQGEYKEVMGDYAPDFPLYPSSFADCGTNCPTESVNWHIAAHYTNALSAKAGLSACYTCGETGNEVVCLVAEDPYLCEGYRLPTEAEWEAAARCGEDLPFAGSESLDEVGWYSSNSGSKTHPVAQKPANGCGLYDMTGNVWEWTQDRYSGNYYTLDGRTDPAGPETGSTHVYRGGCWDVAAQASGVSGRGNAAPSFAHHSIGFRVARTVPSEN